MKTLPVAVIEVENEGLVSLLGKKIFIMCFNYFYYGTLTGVNDTCVKLENVYQVFETGAYSDKAFKDAQKISESWYVQISAIESFGEPSKSVA